MIRRSAGPRKCSAPPTTPVEEKGPGPLPPSPVPVGCTDPKLLDMAWGYGRLAGAAACGRAAKGGNRPKCYGQRRFERVAACTNACTECRQTVYIGFNSGQGDQHPRGKCRSRGRRRKCLSGQEKRPADKDCQRVFFSGADRDRTGYLLVANQSLSQVSYGPKPRSATPNFASRDRVRIASAHYRHSNLPVIRRKAQPPTHRPQTRSAGCQSDTSTSQYTVCHV